MRLPKPAVILFLLFLGGACYAQTKSPKNARFRTPHISKKKAVIMCPIFLESKYPYHGIGVKLGDPFALTYKFYASKHWAFAIDGGKSASGLYNKYYRNAYDKNFRLDTLKSNASMKYLAHKALQDWYGEAKILYQWDANRLAQGLQFYGGLGLQVRNAKIRYDYNYTLGTTQVELSKFGQFTETRFTLGTVAVLGFEYSYFTLPISAFIEVEYFTDTLIDPGYHRFQGGVGVRYIF